LRGDGVTRIDYNRYGLIMRHMTISKIAYLPLLMGRIAKSSKLDDISLEMK
jgi:hypothetical protein